MPAGIDYPDRSRVWVHAALARAGRSAGARCRSRAAARPRSYFSVLARVQRGTALSSAQADMDAVAASLERDFPNEQPESRRAADAAARRSRRRRAADGAAAVRRGRPAPADCDRERLGPAARARHGAASGDGGPHRAGREPRPDPQRSCSPRASCSPSFGGVAGVLLAMWLIGPLRRVEPRRSRRGRRGHGRSHGAAVRSGGLDGRRPAVRARAGAPARAGRRPRRSQAGRARRQQRSASVGFAAVLVAGEIALSLVLLVGAGLTIRSFVKLQHEPPGFNPDHVVTFGVSLPAARYPTPQKKAEFWQRSARRVAADSRRRGRRRRSAGCRCCQATARAG